MPSKEIVPRSVRRDGAARVRGWTCRILTPRPSRTSRHAAPSGRRRRPPDRPHLAVDEDAASDEVHFEAAHLEQHQCVGHRVAEARGRRGTPSGLKHRSRWSRPSVRGPVSPGCTPRCGCRTAVRTRNRAARAGCRSATRGSVEASPRAAHPGGESMPAAPGVRVTRLSEQLVPRRRLDDPART